MKKHLLTTVAFVALAAGPALSADLPVKAPAPERCCGDGWTGYTFGAAFGFGSTDLKARFNQNSTFTAVTTNFDRAGALVQTSTQTQNSTQTGSGSGRGNGALADLILGYSKLIAPQWVAGIQFEGTIANLNFHAAAPSTGASTTTVTTTNAAGAVTSTTVQNSTSTSQNELSANMRWSASAMARLGWLMTQSTLLYGTAGVTYAGFGDGNDFNNFRTWGWSAGAGVEHKLASVCSICTPWSIRLEYRFTDFQAGSTVDPFNTTGALTSVNRNAAGAITSTTTQTTAQVGQTAYRYEPQMHAARVAVVYTFN